MSDRETTNKNNISKMKRNTRRLRSRNTELEMEYQASAHELQSKDDEIRELSSLKQNLLEEVEVLRGELRGFDFYKEFYTTVSVDVVNLKLFKFRHWQVWKLKEVIIFIKHIMDYCLDGRDELKNLAHH